MTDRLPTDRLPFAAVEGPGTALPLRQRRNCRAALLATTALVAVAALLPGVARAADATWLAAPVDGVFNNNLNWSPATVPTGTASFNTSATTSLTFSALFTVVGGWTFNAGASAYTFTIGGVNSVNLNGAGIVINGGSASITNNGAWLSPTPARPAPPPSPTTAA